MNYTNLEVNRRINKKKIFLIGFIIISFISSIVYLYVSNNSTNINTRRKINEIRQDISHLYNYTETMSDFIVDNFKPPEIQLDLKNDNELLKKTLNNTYKIQLDLIRELNEFKNKSLKNQFELKSNINEMNKNFIRKSAMEYLNKYYGFFTPQFNYYIGRLYNSNNYYSFYNNYYYKRNNYLEKLFDYFKLFEELLNIDYENKMVSFAYFSENHKENIQLHPVYIIINNSLEYDYDFLNNIIDYINITEDAYNIKYINDNRGYYVLPYLEKNKIPFKTFCNFPIGILSSNRIENFYNEYEYISSMISFVSVSPQKFM